MKVTLFIIVVSIANLSLAQWNGNPAVNNPICTESHFQTSPTIASDGHSGAIMVWMDARGVYNNMYAQRIDSMGVTLWREDGVAVCSLGINQQLPRIASDGSGGAIIAWYDDENTPNTLNMYAQRINASGTALWGASGVLICSKPRSMFPTIAGDGSGGAIIVWQDIRVNGYFQIYAQRINSSGSVLWKANGVSICSLTSQQANPSIACDASGEAVIAWQDYRSGTHHDLYAQGLTSGGAIRWAADGVLICQTPTTQILSAVTSDGNGGAIISWEDLRMMVSKYYNSIYAQRIDSSGSVLWKANGVSICSLASEQANPSSADDGSGGAIITFTDYRNLYGAIYAQRINSSGSTLWTDGVPVCSLIATRGYPTITNAGAGGAIVTWSDLRNLNYDIFASKVNGAGSLVPVEQAPGNSPVEFTLGQNYPNPFNPRTTISYSLPKQSNVSIAVFNALGQQVAELVNADQSAGNHHIRFDGSSLSSGMYLYRIQAGSFVETRKLLLLK